MTRCLIRCTLTRWSIASRTKSQRNWQWTVPSLHCGRVPMPAAQRRWCAICKQDNTMRTTLRLLAISSLALASIVLMLARVAEARTRPHYGGVVRMESAAAAEPTGLVTEALTSADALGRVQPLLAERWEAQNGG